jgi:hypothetical protein
MQGEIEKASRVPIPSGFLIPVLSEFSVSPDALSHVIAEPNEVLRARTARFGGSKRIFESLIPSEVPHKNVENLDRR